MMDVAEAARRATAGGIDEDDAPDPAASADPDQLADQLEETGIDPPGTGNNRAPAGTLAGLEDWLLDTPEGSYLETDAREYWDPDGGGRTRLMFHISDLAGVTGIPNWLGIIIALAEMYANYDPPADQEEGDTDESGEMMTASPGAEEM